MTHHKHDTLWWQVEPPDDLYEHYDELQTIPIEEQYEAQVPPYRPDQLSSFEYLDGTASHQLFANVMITEAEGGLSFRAPKRYVESANLGKWELEVYGKRWWFKEHDDYGEIAILSDGTSLWIPYLFPFEETDDEGLPLIIDRERCELVITMKSMQTFEPNECPEVAITTPAGTAWADTRLNIEETYGSDRNYYRKFEMRDKPFKSQLVTYDDRWPGLADYLNDPSTQETSEQYHDMMTGAVPFPERYLHSNEPDDWTKRQTADYKGSAFGSIWVPVDELRRGIDADISFPNLT